MFAPNEDANRRLLRARDAIDAGFREPLPVTRLAALAAMSEAHFIRSFKDTFGETPHRYLQRRRVERAMYLLRTTDTSVTDICLEVGWTSLGTFSRTFTAVVGTAPSEFRRQPTNPDALASAEPRMVVPSCFVQRWTRPHTAPGPGRGAARDPDDGRSSRNGEAAAGGPIVRSVT